MPIPSVAIVIGNANDTHIPSLCRLTNTQCNFPMGNQSRVNPDSYHSTLGLSDKYDRVFYFGQQNFSAYTASLLHPLITFRIIPWVSNTHTKPFWIVPWVSHTHAKPFRIVSPLSYTHPSLSHPYRTFRIIRSPTPEFQAFHLRGLTTLFLLRPTHINNFLFYDLNYESLMEVVPKTYSTHIHQEW